MPPPLVKPFAALIMSVLAISEPVGGDVTVLQRGKFLTESNFIPGPRLNGGLPSQFLEPAVRGERLSTWLHMSSEVSGSAEAFHPWLHSVTTQPA